MDKIVIKSLKINSTRYIRRSGELFYQVQRNIPFPVHYSMAPFLPYVIANALGLVMESGNFSDRWRQ